MSPRYDGWPAWLRPAWILLFLILLAAGLRLWQLDVLPPGLFADEAFNALDASRVVTGDQRPLYFPDNNGREPAYIYLLALAIRLFGPETYALRLTSVLIGVVTVPVIYWTASVLLGSGSQDNEPSQTMPVKGLALIAAAGVVVSFWHMSLSRLAFRVILMVPVSALAVGFFWRAWTGGHRRHYVWSGFWFGAAQYTYMAARLLPLVIVLFVLLEIAWDGWRNRRMLQRISRLWWQRSQGLVLMLLVAAVVILPLVTVLLTNPDLLLGRLSGVSVFTVSVDDMPGTPLERIGRNLVMVARNFYDKGDLNLRHNLPDRPVNDPLLAALFTAGWLTALWRFGRPRYRYLLIWLFVALLPTVLSIPAPHALRSAGALAPAAMLYGVGAGTIYQLVWRGLDRWRRRRKAPGSPSPLVATRVLLALLIAVLVISGGWTARDYFGRWAQDDELGAAFDVDLQLAAEATADILLAEEPGAVLVSNHLFLQPHMGFALDGVPTRRSLEEAMVSPTGPREPLPVILEEDWASASSMFLLWRAGQELASSWLQPLATDLLAPGLETADSDGTPVSWLRSSTHQPGWPELAMINLPAEADLEPRHIRYPLDVAFANGMRLVGYDVLPDVRDPAAEDRDFRLSLFWQMDSGEEPPATTGQGPGAFDVFTHLANADGVWETDNGPLSLGAIYEARESGAVIEDVRVLTAPAGMSLGKGYFEVGLYRYRPGQDLAANERIDILDGHGRPVANSIALGAVSLGSLPAPPAASDLAPLGAQFEDRIELSGWEIATDATNRDQLQVTLAWRALDRSPTDYAAFVHLVDDQGRIVSQEDKPPGGVENPTGLWVPGELVQATFQVTVPPDADPGVLRLRIGLYEPVSGRQLLLSSVPDRWVGEVGDSFMLIPLREGFSAGSRELESAGQAGAS
jgi:hypothetical protein